MKKILSVIPLFFYLSIQAQPIELSLVQCKQLALKQNKELEIKREEIHTAELKKKEAYAAYLPKVDVSAGYLHLSDKISLISEDKFLPIGTLTNGRFGFSIDQSRIPGLASGPQELSPELSNNWTLQPNGQPVPLDANGQPFDPSVSPEKLQWKNYTTIPKDELTVDMRNVILGSVSLVQPIYLGGKVREANKMAEIGIDISRQQEQLQMENTLYSVENSYWTVVSVSEKVKVAESYTRLLDKLNHDVEKLYTNGMATKGDILKVKVKYNEANMALTKAQNGYRLSKMALCQQIGLPLESDVMLTDEAPESAEFLTASGINATDALKKRLEIQSLNSLVQLSEREIKLARSNALPTIGLTANYMASNINFFNGFEKDFATSWNVGLMVRIPIIHWGETNSKIRQARSSQRNIELQKAEASEKIELQVAQANFHANEAIKKLRTSRINLDDANENLRLATLSFEEGMISVSELLEAQTAWNTANSEYINARIEARMSETYLNKVAGNMMSDE